MTLKMASSQIAETSVANNNPSQNSSHQMIIFNQGMLLLGSNHLLIYIYLFKQIEIKLKEEIRHC